VLVVPCGSGNDFARALSLRSVAESLSAWRKFSSGGGNVRSIDLGVINPHEHFFCCVGGVGLDAEVARRANRLPRWVRAHGGYILSFLPAVLGFAPVSMKISVPRAEGDAWRAESAKPIIVAAFANAPAYGGGMKIAPAAKLDDGALDVCVIHNMNKLKLCCLFPAVYFGRHLSIRQVEYFQTERLRVETEEPLDVYADGEYVCQTPIEVSVAKRALEVIVNERAAPAGQPGAAVPTRA
jgi:diacylglycerol kinase (ATP)